MQQATNKEPSKIDYALALVVYKKEQGVLKDMAQEVLGEYGKPKMTVKELRAAIDLRLGEVSLSEEVIKMREEGL